MDDPLSAVDPEVGHHIFEECICGALHGKTILLATHGLNFLHDADRILHMDGGEITEEGTFDELIAAERGFAALLKAHGVTSSPRADSPRASKGAAADDDGDKAEGGEGGQGKGDKDAGGLTSEEEREKGVVQMSVFKAYVKATGGMWVPVVTVLGILGSNLSLVASDYWLGLLSRDGMHWRDGAEDNWEYYIYVYIAWLPLVMGLSLVGRLAPFLQGLQAAKRLHRRLIDRILRATMTWIDTTPSGRILYASSEQQRSFPLERTDCSRPCVAQEPLQQGHEPAGHDAAAGF